jgi:heme/copper-type cytochrome/quinol oxidase subunit 2
MAINTTQHSVCESLWWAGKLSTPPLMAGILLLAIGFVSQAIANTAPNAQHQLIDEAWLTMAIECGIAAAVIFIVAFSIDRYQAASNRSDNFSSSSLSQESQFRVAL